VNGCIRAIEILQNHFLVKPSHAKYPEQVFAEHAVHGPVPDYCKAAYDK
jgi:hypothetical protein